MADPVYLPVAEYVIRFGDQEATRLTSEVQPPARDDTKIETAILDSEEEAEGYIARRYPLPLSTVPAILKTWVAALARERLHKTRPTQEVEKAAERARQQLKETAQGLFKLLVEDGSEEVTVGGEQLAMTSGDAACPTISRRDMYDYTNLGGNGSVPRWRQ